MPIKVYIRRDDKGRPVSPDYSHEMLTCVEIIKRLWSSFHHLTQLYVVMVNLKKPSADLVIFSELGIGIVELKHYYGKLTCNNDGVWFAGPKPMQAGVPGKGFRNPHEQVQAYAESVREKLIDPPLWQEPWLPGRAIDWPIYKFHTAVCFTHPDAEIDEFQDQLRKRCRPITLPWEDFSIISLDEITSWVAALRFESGGRFSNQYSKQRFTPTQIIRIVDGLFGFSQWTEINELMPTGNPYAFLSLIEDKKILQVFSLDRDEITIGRDWRSSDVLVPIRFAMVSRNHAKITRAIKGVFIEDVGSTNGTYVNGERVSDLPVKLSSRRVITLGGPIPGPGICTFEVNFEGEEMDGLDKTETLHI